MSTSANKSTPSSPSTAAWAERQRVWQCRFGRRIRLGVEPVEVQLARLAKVNGVLTAVASGIGLIFFALFAAFGRPDIGAIVAGVLIVPIITLAWLEYGLLRLRVAAYLREKQAFENGQDRPRPAS